MKYLGIDYGPRKIGLSLGEGFLAEPHKVLRVENEEDGIKKIKKEIEEQDIKVIIVGVSEGETAKKTKKFVEKLQKETDVEIQMHDETLSTIEAQHLAIEAGLTRTKRKNMEDAFAATVMLQNYLDLK